MIVRDESELQNTQTFSNDYEKVLPGHYRLIEMLGRGGMAEVFLAEDTRLNRSVAIKFLSSEFRKDPERMRRFNQEARAASALNHPNILTIYDIGECDGIQYLVSEYVQGKTLSSRISRGKVPIPEAVGIAIQMASALAVSHQAGIVHRDIKPDNVMVRTDGTVKVLDFGLAKESGKDLADAADADAKTLDRVLTSPGLILGTPQYMSPEQARGQPLDARTDIFSVGIVIFEMVTGRSPFGGSSIADVIAAIVGKDSPRIEEYMDDPPLMLIRIVQKALRKNADDRYGTMDHLLSDLRDLSRELIDLPDTGHETGGTQARPTFQHSRRITIAGRAIPWEKILVSVAVLAGLASFAAWWYSGGTRKVEPQLQGSMRTIGITSWSSGARELVAAASFSPDARMIAFAATKTGSTEIWAKPAAGGDEIQVTKSGYYNQYPVWSPNGQDLAFFSSRGDSRGIWRTAFTGGAQIQVLTDAGPTARPVYWGQDGKIYFQEQSDLFAVNERTSERIRVTDFESKGVKPRSVEISRDETTIAYSIKEDDLWKIKIKRLDSDTSEDIAASKDQIDNLKWRPDGKAVIFSGSSDGAYQLYEAGIRPGDPVQLSNGNSDFFVQDISTDGTKILYGSLSESSDIWMVDTENSKESLVANGVAAEFWADISPEGSNVVFQSVKQADKPFGGSILVKPKTGTGTPMSVSASGFSPVWSTDGKKIAFFRRTDEGIGLWNVSPTGDNAVELAAAAIDPPGYTATPYLKIGTNHLSWSPDNRFVAYSASPGGISNIWRVAADGSGRMPVSANEDPAEIYCCPLWASNGENIVFTSEYHGGTASPKTAYRLWLQQLETSARRVIFETTERFRLLGISEDGKNAIFTQKADPADLTATPESTYVYLLSLQTGAKTKVNTLAKAYFHNVHLSRDGRMIAFVSKREDTTALWIVPVTGGTPRKLLEENDPKILISSLNWSPDGNSIIFSRQTRTTLLSMLAK